MVPLRSRTRISSSRAGGRQSQGLTLPAGTYLEPGIPKWLPRRFGTEPAVTIYFVLTYNGCVLARGVPNKNWNRIMGFYREFALVLALWGE